MRWKLLVAAGAAAGGVWWNARRRSRRPAPADGWADATDPVPPA